MNVFMEITLLFLNLYAVVDLEIIAIKSFFKHISKKTATNDDLACKPLQMFAIAVEALCILLLCLFVPLMLLAKSTQEFYFIFLTHCGTALLVTIWIIRLLSCILKKIKNVGKFALRLLLKSLLCCCCAIGLTILYFHTIVPISIALLEFKTDHTEIIYGSIDKIIPGGKVYDVIVVNGQKYTLLKNMNSAVFPINSNINRQIELRVGIMSNYIYCYQLKSY